MSGGFFDDQVPERPVGRDKGDRLRLKEEDAIQAHFGPYCMGCGAHFYTRTERQFDHSHLGTPRCRHPLTGRENRHCRFCVRAMVCQLCNMQLRRYDSGKPFTCGPEVAYRLTQVIARYQASGSLLEQVERARVKGAR